MVDLARRVHWARHKEVASTVVQFSLHPIELLLLIEPRLWEPCPAQSAMTSVQGFLGGTLQGRALEGRFDVQASQEDLERQNRSLEVAA